MIVSLNYLRFNQMHANKPVRVINSETTIGDNSLFSLYFIFLKALLKLRHALLRKLTADVFKISL